MNTVHLIDCMEFMRSVPDKYYELAIVDPPYGIGVKTNMGKRKGTKNDNPVAKWDSFSPNKEYFTELFRVSRNQIIWGGNYFMLPATKSFIIWGKPKITEYVSFSMAEYAWTSFNETSKIKYFMNDVPRIHPTQKPVALYKWLLSRYAKPNDKIFDSHVGSGSIRIACHDMGFDFVGCEIDKDYWQAQEERYKTHINQQDLFSGKELQESIMQGVLV